MNALIEKVLSVLFPVQVPQIQGIVIQRKRTDRSPQYPPFLEGEEEVIKGSLRVGRPKTYYPDAIARVRAEELEREFVNQLEEILS